MKSEKAREDRAKRRQRMRAASAENNWLKSYTN